MNSARRSFRLVCAPEEISTVESLLNAQGYAFEADPFFAPSRRLCAEPRPLGSGLAAFFGLIYIQDRASMLPPVALRPPAGAAVLDMCASPGSKTGQLAGMVGASGLVLGNEPNPSRLATLRRNLHTMNLAQTATCCRNGEDMGLPDQSWDFIQLDPPCSGWGTVERNPKVMDIWKGDKVEPLIRMQRTLLREAVRLLRPGGTLVYSTCTTNVLENECQVLFAEELGLRLEPLEPVPGFTLEAPDALPEGREGVWRLRVLPGDTQGFFVARLRKPEAAAPAIPGTPDISGTPPAAPFRPLRYEAVPSDVLREQGCEPSLLPGPVGAFEGSLHLLPEQALALLPDTFRWQGLYAGKTSRNGEIRLSPRLRLAGTGPFVDVEGASGLVFLTSLLQGQSLPAPGSVPGDARRALLRWNGLPLGWVGVKNKRLLWSER